MKKNKAEIRSSVEHLVSTLRSHLSNDTLDCLSLEWCSKGKEDSKRAFVWWHDLFTVIERPDQNNQVLVSVAVWNNKTYTVELSEHGEVVEPLRLTYDPTVGPGMVPSHLRHSVPREDCLCVN